MTYRDFRKSVELELCMAAVWQIGELFDCRLCQLIRNCFEVLIGSYDNASLNIDMKQLHRYGKEMTVVWQRYDDDLAIIVCA